MNSSFVADPISQNQLLVTILLVVVGVMAVLTVIGMLVGARNKRRRADAEEQEKARLAGLEAHSADIPATSDPAASAPDAKAADPVPPLADSPVTGAAPAQQSALREDHSPVVQADPITDEPIAAAAPLGATPASIAADAPTPAGPDDASAPVTRLKGLGPKIATRLAELGITRIDQLAWLDDAEAASLDTQLGAFQGRMERDRWREQARLLAQGDRAGYEAQFGKLG